MASSRNDRALEPLLHSVVGWNNQRKARPRQRCPRGSKGAAAEDCQAPRHLQQFLWKVNVSSVPLWTPRPPLYKLHTPKPRPAPSSVFLAELGKEGINLTAPGLTVRIYSSNPWAIFTTSIFLLICRESLAVMCKCFLSSE